MSPARPEPVTAAAQQGEGPLWDAARSRLMWVDLAGRQVHALDVATGAQASLNTAYEPTALALVDGRDEYLLAFGHDVCLLSWPERVTESIATLRSGRRANDGAVDPAGRYLIGTLSDEANDFGGAALYQIEAGHLRTLFGGATISNGIDWSPDGTTMYYVDTPLERVDAFDYDVTTGRPCRRRVLADLADVPGRPDGLTVDADGGVWVAMARGGAAVRRFTADGRHDRVIDLPVPHVTSLAFGGAGLADLYITTSQLRMGPEDLRHFPNAGSVFLAADVGVPGRSSFAYRPA